MVKYCKCGCETEIPEGNTYVMGHQNRDPENKKKNSEGGKKRFEDPNERKKISEAGKKRFEDPNELKKNSEAQLKHHKEHPERAQKHSKDMKKIKYKLILSEICSLYTMIKKQQNLV